jgi:hypothetical protein
VRGGHTCKLSFNIVVEVLEAIIDTSYHVFITYMMNYCFTKIFIDGQTIDKNGIVSYSRTKPFLFDPPAKKLLILVLIGMIL